MTTDTADGIIKDKIVFCGIKEVPMIRPDEIMLNIDAPA